ncbi:MAG: error-prone DNA polymerase [Alphaproteobacteria bacterium]|nr:error-prone DNA polymerase [Alphaproteobacteria bacterium]
MSYAELAVATNFSFLRGASHAEELVEQAAALGLSTIGIADRNTLAGVVRAHVAAKEKGLRTLTGARLVTADGFETLCYPIDHEAYERLCRLLTRGNRRAKKGQCHLELPDILAESAGQIFIVLPPENLSEAFRAALAELVHVAPGRCYLGAAYLYGARAARRLAELEELSRATQVPLVAHNDVHYHVPERQMLADVLASIREKTTLEKAGRLLAANAERYLKPPEEMARLFARYPEAVARTLEIAGRIGFSLDELRYDYPGEIDGGLPGETAQQALERLAWEGAATRYPNGPPEKVRAQIAHELALIGELNYAPYFLTVWDIVRYARSEGILCQGRGSAANSAVCYVLGITAVDPERMDLLFERFVSPERNEPPDIDVDFEHERREEVIQYLYEKYGRHRAGLAATVISYRSKSAIRDVGKAFGLSQDMVSLLSANLTGWVKESLSASALGALGLDATDPRLRAALACARVLRGFPRHLSQHVGGFVITQRPLEDLIPIGNAAMPDRTFVEWDKDDLDALRILKIDVLALGMLTCIAKAFALLKRHYGRTLEIASVPLDDPAVYEMLQQGDSLGVFQVESRAQMSMLPRLKPKTFFDLVIEVAIVRPGPIQGDMVHPYLRRRDGIEPVEFPTKELEEVLRPTLGVPLFQEQAMKIAIVAAGFTPSEADRLRRAMATFRRLGTIHAFEEKFVSGMVARGYERAFAERCFHQIEGFGDYGFPMSHAASFALLVYVSAWLKHHYPEVFCAAILNAQPMGFYAPAQLVRDAQNHGVKVRAPDVNASHWDHTLEKAEGGRCALRLGFRQIKGFREEDAAALVAARGAGYDGVRHLAAAAALSSEALTLLADADAFRALGLDRRQALWAVKGLDGGAQSARTPTPELPLFRFADPERLRPEEEVALPAMRLGEHIVCDYATLRLSLKAHPLSLLRGLLAARRVVPHGELGRVADGARVRVAGLALVRQRPGTAHGVTFATLEDETGIANVIVWADVFEHFRRPFLASRLMLVKGRLQRQGLVTHIVAEEIEDLSAELHRLAADVRAEIPVPAHGDETGRQTASDHRILLTRHPRDAVADLIPKSRDFR